MTKILCVIPSRIGSTRLPNKPLLPINGKPMIQMVYENALKCSLFDKVIVATDSENIASVIQAINGEVMLTSETLFTGTDRVAVVASQFPDMDLVVNLQGDQPFIKVSMLEQLLLPYLGSNCTTEMATLALKLSPKELADPNVVKVITDLKSNAIYFSRAALPYIRNNCDQAIPVYQHIGLYAFRRDFLMHFTTLKPTPLEITESLEQLRAIEYGFKIRVNFTSTKVLEINTMEDYQLSKSFMIENDLL